MVERTHASSWWPTVYEPLKRVGQQVADWFTPKSDAAASPDAYRIAIELPGVSRDDIDLFMKDDRLVVKGEKRVEREEKTDNYFFSERDYGAFQRSFHMPPDTDTENVSADFQDGVLKISIPKVASASSRTRKIPIAG